MKLRGTVGCANLWLRTHNVLSLLSYQRRIEPHSSTSRRASVQRVIKDRIPDAQSHSDQREHRAVGVMTTEQNGGPY